MGGTGLEPVTPSLSIWCSGSRQFAGVRSDSMVERHPCRDERSSERERTLILAILATQGPVRGRRVHMPGAATLGTSDHGVCDAATSRLPFGSITALTNPCGFSIAISKAEAIAVSG